MISCDEGNACVVGRGNKVLAEWATLTYAIIRLFTENGEDKEFKENLKEKMRGALEMDFAMAFSEKTGEEILKEAIESMKETILKNMEESWKI